MDICFLIPLLWVLGASVLAGLLGWLWGKKGGSVSSAELNAKDLEIQNLRKQVVEVKDKTDNALAVLGRESRETEQEVTLWRKKYNDLQVQVSSADPDHTPDTASKKATASTTDKELKTALAKIKKLEGDKEALMLLSDQDLTKTKKNASDQKAINKDLDSKAKKEYKAELEKLKAKLKKAKAKNKILKKKATKVITKEIEITKSIDLETLKKMLDKVPLKKVSERIINRSSSK